MVVLLEDETINLEASLERVSEFSYRHLALVVQGEERLEVEVREGCGV